MPADAIGGLVEDITKLQTDRRHRDERGAFFIEGVRNVVSAVDNGFTFERLVVSGVLLTSRAGRAAVRRLRERGVPVSGLSPEGFRKVSTLARASGVAAIVGQRWSVLHRTPPRSGSCWLSVSRVRAPGNLGTLLRTSAAFGGAGLLLIGGAVDPFEPAVVRASMGALFRQVLVRTGARQLADWARRHRLSVIGVSGDGDGCFDEVGYGGAPILMLGEERRGLDGEQRRLCHRLVRIPMVPGTDSLNVSVAGSLAMYEAFRQARGRRRGG